MHRIYVASSWRNGRQPDIVRVLRLDGHEVYDFRDPFHERGGFRWDQATDEPPPWTKEKIREILEGSMEAAGGYLSDYRAMNWADIGLLVLPCGRSAHLELGYMAGRGKRTIVLLEDGEPDLMWLMTDHLCVTLLEVRNVLDAN